MTLNFPRLSNKAIYGNYLEVHGKSCLWCNELIDCKQLAEEATSTKQRNAQRYVDGVQAPSVITLNAVACSHAVDQYLFSTLELQKCLKRFIG